MNQTIGKPMDTKWRALDIRATLAFSPLSWVGAESNNIFNFGGMIPII